MRKFIGIASSVGAAAAAAVLLTGPANADANAPCLAPGSTLANCVSILPIAGSGSSSGSGDSLEVFDSGWFGLPPLIDKELELVPQKPQDSKPPIQVKPHNQPIQVEQE